jgi:ATP-binding cassette subfamily C (CFTR/MRP) protein 1
VPQDPVLFSGSVRSNLDPFNDHGDDRLLSVLTRVGLINSNKVGEGEERIRGLGDVVEEDGSNFSVGQRQLLVIARALLSECSIVLMDEATAAIDVETDAMIQKAMRSEFKNATSIVVAHRINTIMDSSHILVMDDGRCKEFDAPRVLLERGGLFKDLVDSHESSHS